ncbi:MAG: CDP-glycerol glycerophosphotransferase family protein, partial [Eubacteriales bacterium]|nr:CDP-glycerol glycerophosphotransferase family protein [Eubacteriales bacterium]
DGKLKENGYKLVFYPHIEMQKDMKYFSTASERIILADKEHFDVQNLLMTCSLLITDYSSVFFDVAYLKRPELFYQFDAEEFREYHYKKGYFDYERDGFGEVCYDEERLLAAIGEYLENGMKLKPGYEKRTDSFFLLYDDKNRERTFETVQKL